MSDLFAKLLNPPFAVSRGKVSQAGGAGTAKEGNYSADLRGTTGDGLAGPIDSCAIRTQSEWGTRWFREHARVVAQDVDAHPNLDLNLVQVNGRSALRITNCDGTHGIDVDIPLGPGDFEQQEAFPSISLPMKKIEFRKRGNKAQIIVNDGAVNYVVKNGRIFQTD
ncbi:hypothetical protein IV102_10590 [bacterium]|nr:hypothetical protein [bacterium]